MRVMLVHTATGGDALLEFYSTAGSRTREDQWERLFIREAADRYGYVLDGWVNDVDTSRWSARNGGRAA